MLIQQINQILCPVPDPVRGGISILWRVIGVVAVVREIGPANAIMKHIDNMNRLVNKSIRLSLYRITHHISVVVDHIWRVGIGITSCDRTIAVSPHE